MTPAETVTPAQKKPPAAVSVDLRLGDCLEILPLLAAGSIDAVVTDPPYGKKPNGHFGQKDAIRFSIEDYSWDVKPPREIFDEIFRVSCNQIIWGANYFIEYLKSTNCFLVWDKRNGNNPYADVELAWTSFTSVSKKFTHFWLGAHISEKLYHPTQKPLPLLIWCLLNYTNPGDTILDPFMGSGTTGVACVQTGRNFIGIEIDPKYFAIAERRIEEAQMQIRMPI